MAKKMSLEELAWMQREKPTMAYATEESAKSRELIEFEQIEERAERDREATLQRVQAEIENMAARRDRLANPPQDTFPSGTMLVINVSEQARNYGERPTILTKSDEGVWLKNNAGVVGWSGVVQMLQDATIVQQITEYVVLPGGDKFGATGEPVKVSVSKEPTRGQRAAATRAKNRAAKAAEFHTTTVTPEAAKAMATSKPRKV